MNISKNIKALREKKKLKKFELADLLGLSATQITYYEAGTTYPKLDNLIKLAEILGVSAGDLLDKDFSVDRVQDPPAAYTSEETVYLLGKLMESDRKREAAIAALQSLQSKYSLAARDLEAIIKLLQ